MTDISRTLTQNLKGEMGRWDDLVNDDSMSADEMLKHIGPQTMEMVVASWLANLDVKTQHNLFKSSINDIR